MSRRRQYRSTRISSSDYSENEALSEPTNTTTKGQLKFFENNHEQNADISAPTDISESDSAAVSDQPQNELNTSDDGFSNQSEELDPSVLETLRTIEDHSQTPLDRERVDNSESNESIVESLGEEVFQAKKAPRMTRSLLNKKKITATTKRGKIQLTDSGSSDNDVRNLYDAILNDNLVSPKEITKGWIESYKSDRESAILALQQFFISSSGCTARLTPEMRELETEQMILELSDQFDSRTTDYPLIMRRKKWQNFRARFSEFLYSLVHLCENSIIYDDYLLTEMTTLLIILSDSKIRDFRHTATYAAMKLMSVIAEVTSTVEKNLAIAEQRLRNVKCQVSPPADIIENLTDGLKLLEENQIVLKDNIDSLFSAIFVHRYIDVSVDIRAICIVELGVCMQNLPEHFIADQYLKYIGWNLHDEAAEVRYECIQSLLPLYAFNAFTTKLEVFTRSFKERIVAMALDLDFEVGTEAVKLVTALLIYCPDYITDQDCESIYNCVYSRNRGLAHAAGLFLNERLFKLDKNALIGVKSRRGKQRLPNTLLIRDLIEFFIESENLEHAAYLVDSLIESNVMMKDWECITDLLLEDTGADEEPLSSLAETCLIEIMICSVKQTATGQGPMGRTPEKKIQSKQELKQLNDEKQKLTGHFIPTLPLLLDKYKTDPEKLVFLLKVPQYFNLEEYTTLREEHNLDSLLSSIQEIVRNTSNVDILEVAAKTIEFMCGDKNKSIFTRCDIARSILLDSLVNGYKEAIDAYKNSIDDYQLSDRIYNFVESLKKVAIFYCSHDMNSWNTQNSLFEIIESAKNSSNEIPPEIVVYSISAYFYSILWSNNSLQNSTEDSSAELESAACQLQIRLGGFMNALKFFVNTGLSNDTIDPKICENAFLTICDLTVMFCTQVEADSSLYPVVYVVEMPMLITLNRFLVNKVFVEPEENGHDEEFKIKELNNRRNLLAAFCKLITNNVVSLQWGVDIFKHYVKYNDDYGDIIKATISCARGINKINCAVAMQQSLESLFSVAFENFHNSAEEFTSIKELARRFALLFGLHMDQNREALIALHKAGILFATRRVESVEPNNLEPSANLAFLEVLVEFTGKLVNKDKLYILEFLNSKVPSNISNKNIEWKPLSRYRTSLQRGTEGSTTAKNQNKGAEEVSAQAAGEQSVSVTKGKKKKKRGPNKTPLPVTKVRYEPSIHESSQLSSLGSQTRRLNLTEETQTPRTRSPELYADDEIMDTLE